MEIVQDDEVAIDAIPLVTKPPVIVEWKIIKEGKMGYFQLIRADRSSKRYSSMIQMLQNIDRGDLETLWKLVKAKHKNIKPEEAYERVLWGDLKVIFEPDVEKKLSIDKSTYDFDAGVTSWQVDEYSVMADELLWKIFILATEPSKLSVWKTSYVARWSLIQRKLVDFE
ncbi:hypothetical protein Tco_0853787 [Tanacetum coccineum]